MLLAGLVSAIGYHGNHSPQTRFTPNLGHLLGVLRETGPRSPFVYQFIGHIWSLDVYTLNLRLTSDRTE